MTVALLPAGPRAGSCTLLYPLAAGRCHGLLAEGLKELLELVYQRGLPPSMIWCVCHMSSKVLLTCSWLMTRCWQALPWMGRAWKA